MKKYIKVVYALQSGIMTADSLGYRAIRHFMGEKTLNNPECTVFFAKTPKYFNADTFQTFLPLEKHKGIRAIAAVAGIDKADLDRVVITYERYTHQFAVSFPAHEKIDAMVRRVLNSIEKDVPDIRQYRTAPSKN